LVAQVSITSFDKCPVLRRIPAASSFIRTLNNALLINIQIIAKTAAIPAARKNDFVIEITVAIMQIAMKAIKSLSPLHASKNAFVSSFIRQFSSTTPQRDNRYNIKL